MVKHLGEGGPVGAGAADGLGEHPVAAGVLVGLLVGGGDAYVLADRLVAVAAPWSG